MANHTEAANAASSTVAAGDRQVANWLFLVCIGIAALVIFGGWVRLSHSGLSMAEWRPLTGLLPPLSAEAWENAFGLYRDTPEYRIRLTAGLCHSAQELLSVMTSQPASFWQPPWLWLM